jgi:hypothetical protein
MASAPPASRPWRRILHIVAAVIACAGALWQLSLMLRLFSGRAGYPWDIEWLEGAALYQAHRVKEGQVTYGPPQGGYLPLLHPPLYPALLGVLGKVLPLDYPMARAVSMVFFLGSAALVLRALLRHHEDEEGGKIDGWALGLLSAGIAAAGVPILEGFYDMVREDIMAVWLCVLLAVLADPAERKLTPRRIAACAAVITAILYTRLPAVFLPVWVTLFVFARHRRSGLLLMLAGISGCGLTLVALQYVSKGWYWMYTVSMLQDHALFREKFWTGLVHLYKGAPYYPALFVVALGLGVTRNLSARAALWFGMYVASFPSSFLPWAKVGGYFNDFMPTCFLLGPATAFLVADAVKAFGRRPGAALSVRAAAYVGLCVHLFLATYDIHRFLPNGGAWTRAKKTSDVVAKLEGGVISPRHPFVPVRVGIRTPQFADMPYLDLALSGYRQTDLGPYLDKLRARWAIVNGAEVGLVADEIAVRYQLERRMNDPPRMTIGMASSLRYLMRWREDEPNARVLFDFEGPLAGWEAEGDAFAASPTVFQPRGQPLIRGGVGQKLANSFHPSKRDGATGTLKSPPFLIDRPNMALRVGGGWTGRVRVQLEVEGKMERTSHGIFEGTEAMTKLVWDVRPFLWKKARLVLVDEDTALWGHLTCDHVVMY